MAVRLPVEVVTHIMQFLSVSDRKDAALVCRAWYEASLDPILQKDVIIHFYASSAASNSRAIPRLSRRRLPHLILNDFDTSLDAKAVVVNSCEHLASNLKSLSLRGSNITERTFVELLSQCRNLESLDLSCCNSLFMSGQLLEKNSDIQVLRIALENVKEVNLSSIRFLTDATFNRIITVCQNIERLTLASAPITCSTSMYYPPGTTRCANGAVLTFRNILNFAQLQTVISSINFSRTQIGDEQIVELVSLPDLHLLEISLVSCRNISDDGIASICKYQKGITTLDLRECPELTNGSLMCITSSLNQMKNLYMSKCKQLSDHATMGMHKLSCLEVVDLSECFQLTSAGLIKGLCGNTTSLVTHLNLNCCSGINDSFTVKMCECLPLLSHLDLGSCFSVSDKSVHAVSRSLKYLRYLRFAWCKAISDLGLLGLQADASIDSHEHEENGECRCTRKHPTTVIFKKPSDKKAKPGQNMNQSNLTYTPVTIQNLAGLRFLDLSACKNLTDMGLVQSIKFPELKVLILGMLPKLTEKGIMSIVKSNKSIEELNLSQNVAVTDVAMETITSHLQRLQNLNLFGCDQLTNQSVYYIQRYCKGLRHLDVSFCSLISADAVEKLELGMKTLLTVQKRMIGSA